MAVGVTQNPDFIINGSYGELIALPGSGLAADNVLHLANVQQVNAKITKNKQEVFMSGTRKARYKLMGVMGDGTIRQFRVTSNFLAVVGNVFHPAEGRVADDNARNIHANIDYHTTLVVNVDDPEALGYESLRLLGVKFWEIPIGWRVNEMIEDEVPFTFENFEFINKITGSLYDDKYAERYASQNNL